MVNMMKVDREVRRILRRVPVLGKRVDFPGKKASRFASSIHGPSRSGSISLCVESQLHALSGLKQCTTRQQEQLHSQAAQLVQFETQIQQISRQLEREQCLIWERLEFSRREVMLEIQHLRRTGLIENREDGSPQAIVKDADLIQQQRGGSGIRVNLGCGHKPLDGFINVDSRDLPGVQVVASVDNLPFHQNELAELYSSHLLEHFPPKVLQQVLLPYWHNLLAPGGKFSLVVPDSPSMMRLYAGGQMSFEDISLVTFGGQEYAGNLHYTMFSTSSMAEILEQAGFGNIALVAEGRQNGLCLEFEMTAEKIQ